MTKKNYYKIFTKQNNLFSGKQPEKTPSTTNSALLFLDTDMRPSPTATAAQVGRGTAWGKTVTL